MKTTSVMLQTLCVPCACRCRYCLLSWDGRAIGADWERSKHAAAAFDTWIRENRPELRFHFAFGYSMEHPALPDALDFLREIGSVGATGMESRFFENTVAELCCLSGEKSDIFVRRAMQNSKALSSDVSAAFDPNYPSVMEKNNSCYFGKGLVFNKYTGARGKSGSNDANAEYIAYLRSVIEKEGITFQTSELGKVDEGGGGTIAYILANLGMEVIDFGVAVLNMHAPFEVTSKADIYEAYRAYRAFLK